MFNRENSNDTSPFNGENRNHICSHSSQTTLHSGLEWGSEMDYL